MAIEFVIASITIALFIIFDLLPIFYQKQWKAFWVYVILISFAYVVHILYLFDIKLPSPAVPIKKLVSYIFRL